MPIPQLKRALPAAALCAALAGAPAAHAAPTQWRATDLGSLGGGYTLVNGLNAAGQVVGVSSTGSAFHAFVWEDGRMRDLGTLGGGGSQANAISSSGQVTGYAALAPVDGRAAIHAFRYGGGALADLGALRAGSHSFGRAINASGQVAGDAAIIPEYNAHAFRASPGGAMTDLGTLGGVNSEAYLINDAGTVAGLSSLAGDTARHGFVSNGAGMTDLGTLGGRDSRPNAINAAGQIVGAASNAAGETRAFLYDGGALRELGTLGGSFSSAHDINDAGLIVGASSGADGQFHAVLWRGGAITDLSTLGTLATARPTAASAINASGQILGQAYGGAVTLFFYSNGEMVDLRYLLGGFGDFGLYTDAYLNDAGQIAGSGFDHASGTTRSFLLTPLAAVPEPAPFATLALGIAAGTALARRRRARRDWS